MKHNGRLMQRLALVLGLALASCGSETDPPREPTPPQSAPSPQAPPLAERQEADPDIAKGEIPQRFHGVWDYEKGTCDPTSDMRMVIAARQIDFYESTGLVSGVGQDGASAIADLVMSGEGEEWFETLRLTLSEDGNRLETSDASQPPVKDAYPRKRCPA